MQRQDQCIAYWYAPAAPGLDPSLCPDVRHHQECDGHFLACLGLEKADRLLLLRNLGLDQTRQHVD